MMGARCYSAAIRSERCEVNMSARNGQRARFHRNRKRRVLRLQKMRALAAELRGKKPDVKK